MHIPIPFLNLQPAHQAIRQEIFQSFEEVYDASWFILGSRLNQFEQEFALFNQVPYAVGVSNGLDALFLSLKALGIGPGDEVIVPAHTFVATLLAVTHTGALPVLTDVHPATCNLLVSGIAPVITSRTRAILPVHLYGQACEMDAIHDIAMYHGLALVEDNAQAHGAAYLGRPTGSWGTINATSFYPGKNLGALGDGGAITTSDEELAKKVRLLRNYGAEAKYRHEIAGYNMRLDEMQAAFLSVKLKYLNAWTGQRRQIAAWYFERLTGIEGLSLPETHAHATHVFHNFVVRTDKRDEMAAALAEARIGTLIHYPVPPHLQPAFGHLGYKKGSFPLAEGIAETCLSLPVWPGLTEPDIDYIADTIKRLYNG